MGRSHSQSGGNRRAFTILTGKPIGNRTLGKRTHRWDVNVRTELRKIVVITRNSID